MVTTPGTQVETIAPDPPNLPVVNASCIHTHDAPL